MSLSQNSPRSLQPASEAATDARLVVIYERVSTAPQAKDGSSIETQEASLRRHVLLNEDCAAPHLLNEEGGASARKGKKRPKYEELRRLIDAGEVKLVVAAKPDRLGRSVTEYLAFLTLCAERGTRVFTLNGGEVSTTTATGKLIAGVLGMIAEFESDLRSERVTEVFAHQRSEGHFVGKPPWGYMRPPDDKRRIVPSADAWIVRRAFELYAEGATVGAVAAWINSQPKEERGPVRLDFVSKMLRKETYAGRSPINTKSAAKTSIPGDHEALCPPERWERVQELLRRNEKVGYRGSKVQPFGHLARCGACLGPLRHRKTNDGGRYHYVACARGCGARAWPAWQFEMAVVMYLCSLPLVIEQKLTDGSWSELLADAGSATAVKEELTKLETGRASVLRLVTSGAMSDAEATPLIRKNDARTAELRPEYERLARSADELRGELERLRDDLRFGRGDHPGAALHFWQETGHEDRIQELSGPLKNVWLLDNGLAFQFNHGLTQDFPVPFAPARSEAAKAAEAARLGFGLPGVAEEVDRNVRSPRRARSRGRSPSPPCAGQRARG